MLGLTLTPKQIIDKYYRPKPKYGLHVFLPQVAKWATHPIVKNKMPNFGFDYYYNKMTDVQKAYYDRYVRVKDGQQANFHQHTQGTQDWRDSRSWRITSSDFGAVLGLTRSFKDGTPEDVVLLKCGKKVKKIKKRDQRRMDNGSAMEVIVREQVLAEERAIIRDLIEKAVQNGQETIEYIEQIHQVPTKLIDAAKDGTLLDVPDDEILSCENRGLAVKPECPWMGGSSDGNCFLFGDVNKPIFLLEIKVPEQEVYPLMKIYQMCQPMANCFFADFAVAKYVSWTPSFKTSEIKVYNETMCEQYVLLEVTRFYFEQLFPALVQTAEEKRIRDEAFAKAQAEVDAGVPGSAALLSQMIADRAIQKLHEDIAAGRAKAPRKPRAPSTKPRKPRVPRGPRKKKAEGTTTTKKRQRKSDGEDNGDQSKRQRTNNVVETL